MKAMGWRRVAGAKARMAQAMRVLAAMALAAAAALALPAAAQVSAGAQTVAVAAETVPDSSARGPGKRWFSVFSVEFVNRGKTAVALGQAKIDGDVMVCMALGCPQVATADFEVYGSDGCSGATLAPGAACTLQIRFTPSAAGTRVARLVFAASDGSTAERILSARGTSQPTDCVLDWAQRTYQDLFAGASGTFTLSPFVVRCYQDKTLCVGSDAFALPNAPASASVYYTREGRVLRLAGLAELAALATEAPPSSRRCDQIDP